MIKSKSVTKLLSCAALCFASLATVLAPATANASWSTAGNFKGCVTYHKPVQKIGSYLYSTAKMDCRYSSQKNQIASIRLNHRLKTYLSSGGYGKDMGQTNKGAYHFAYTTLKSLKCVNTPLAAARNSSYARIYLTNGQVTLSSKQENWRSFRTHRCY